MADELKPWVVREVPDRTRRIVKMYAAEHGMTMAQAVEALVDNARGPSWKVTQHLVNVCAAVLKGDFEEAQAEAKELEELLESGAAPTIARELVVDKRQRRAQAELHRLVGENDQEEDDE